MIISLLVHLIIITGLIIYGASVPDELQTQEIVIEAENEKEE